MSRAPLLCSVLLLATATTEAQDLGVKAPPPGKPVLLRNAVIHTITKGTIIGGTLWFQDGVIRGVHPADEQPQLPAGATPIELDLQNQHVYPGLIAAHTSLGLQDHGMVRQSSDVAELNELAPEAMAMVAINPDSTLLPVTRSNGVLAAAVFPQGGLLPGRVAVIQLDGWTNADLAVHADAGAVVNWPTLPDDPTGAFGRGRFRRPGAPGAATAGTAPTDPAAQAKQQRTRIDDAFTQAKAWAQARAAEPTTPIDLRWQALAPAARGQAPVFVLADELEQIESAVLWAKGRGLAPVIVGGRDALLCAELLVQHKVPVILDGVHKLPRRDDVGYDEPFAAPARLAAAGVRFCLASGEAFYNERNLAYGAATAIAFGLDRQQALAAITSDAAAILGVADHLGSLEVGKDATLFIADGSPLELTTKISSAYIRGRQIDLRNKQTELAKKYREKYRQLGLPK